MNIVRYLTHHADKLFPTDPDALCRLAFAARGAGVRGGVGVGLRPAVRLDTDPQTDPIKRLTVQVGPPNSGPRSIQTDPSRGLSPQGCT